MKEYDKMKPEQLVDELIKEVHFDAHSIRTSFRRSPAREEINRRAAECIPALGDRIEKDYPREGKFVELYTDNDRAAWAVLMLANELPDTAGRTPAYAGDIPYGEQHLSVWRDWCKQAA